jgi:hypothetical protein
MHTRIKLAELELYDVISTPNTLPEPYNNAGSATVISISKQFVTFKDNGTQFRYQGYTWKEKKTFKRNGVVRDDHCYLKRKYDYDSIVLK